jgi:hypothetical protein
VYRTYQFGHGAHLVSLQLGQDDNDELDIDDEWDVVVVVVVEPDSDRTPTVLTVVGGGNPNRDDNHVQYPRAKFPLAGPPKKYIGTIQNGKNPVSPTSV